MRAARCFPVNGDRFPDRRQGHSHWRVENSSQWSHYVIFREDNSRVRVWHASDNLALVRKITHNLLQQKTSLKRGIKTNRIAAALDESYLLKVVGVTPNIC